VALGFVFQLVAAWQHGVVEAMPMVELMRISDILLEFAKTTANRDEVVEVLILFSFLLKACLTCTSKLHPDLENQTPPCRHLNNSHQKTFLLCHSLQ
jgi:hypothetical protein